MTEKDIMIGDYLMYGEIIIRVEEIYSYEVFGTKHYLINGGAASNADVCIFDPIPITEEILEKNGWDTDYPSCCAEDKDYQLEICYNGHTAFWTINDQEYLITPLPYVHNLQHALRLCGIEKEIVL